MECFAQVPTGISCAEEPFTIMMTLPAITSLGLTREQVMPFLKKMENGQQREGKNFSMCPVIKMFLLADILKVLQDLKETSLHSVEILKHFVVRV